MLTPNSNVSQWRNLSGRSRLHPAHPFMSVSTLARNQTDIPCSGMLRQLLSIVFVVVICGCATVKTTSISNLTPELATASPRVAGVLARTEEMRVQILVSEVVTNRHGKAELRRSGYRVGAEYFYPASSIKLTAAVAALQTLEALQMQHGVADLIETPLEIAALFPGDAAQTNDVGNLACGCITVGQEIRKIGLVSDNQAFNRLYDLVGHEALNRQMHALGLKSAVINHRLSESRNIPDMFATAAMKFRLPNADTIQIPARRSSLLLTNHSSRLKVGDGFIKGEQLIRTPMEFHQRNGISLIDLQNLLIKAARPDIDLGTAPLFLTPSHRSMLLDAMSRYPGESTNPVYSAERYPDLESKFLLPGIRRVFPASSRGDRIEVTGKPGQAYGFSIENSYVFNPRNGRALFVTAVIYANSDGVLNDDKYDYATVAEPFLADLGEWAARRWLNP